MKKLLIEFLIVLSLVSCHKKINEENNLRKEEMGKPIFTGSELQNFYKIFTNDKLQDKATFLGENDFKLIESKVINDEKENVNIKIYKNQNYDVLLYYRKKAEGKTKEKDKIFSLDFQIQPKLDDSKICFVRFYIDEGTKGESFKYGNVNEEGISEMNISNPQEIQSTINDLIYTKENICNSYL